MRRPKWTPSRLLPVLAAAVALVAIAPVARAQPGQGVGGVERDVARLVAELERARGVEHYVLLRMLWQQWERADPSQVEAALAAVAADLSVPPPYRAYAGTLEAYARRRRGDLAGSKRRIAELGYVADWLVAGPFDNDNKVGLEQTLVPEHELAEPIVLDRSFDGKSRPVRWRQPPAAHPYGWLDFGALMHPQEDICAFATTFVASEGGAARRPLSVWLGVSGAFALFWNDREALRSTAYRHLDSDRHAADVTLEPGFNRLTVKVCGDARRAPALSLRLAERDGSPARGLTVSSALDASTRAAAAMRERAGVEPRPERSTAPPGGAIQQLEAAHERAPGTPALRETYARYLAITGGDPDGSHQARDLAARAADDAPTVARCLLAASLAEDRNQQRVWVDKAAGLLTDATPLDDRVDVLLAQASLARSGPNWREAVPLYGEVRRLDPDRVEAVLGEVDLYVEAGLGRTALGVLEKALGRQPRSVALLRAISTQYRALGRDTEADEAEARYAALRFDDGGYLKRQVDLATARRDVAGAKRWVERLLESEPASSWAHGVAARALLALGLPDEAVATYRRALAIAPEDITTLRALADLHGELGQQAEQLALLKGILLLQPQAEAVRAYLEHIEPSTAHDDERYAWPAERFLALRTAVDTHHPRRMLRKLSVSRVFDNGLSTRFHQVVFQPLTEEAAQASRTYAFVYHADRQVVRLRTARVYRTDGRIDEAVTSGSVAANDPSINMYTLQRSYVVQLPPLHSGDVVELRYRIEDVAVRNEMSDSFGEVELLQSTEPIASAEYVLITPLGREMFVSTTKPPGLKTSDVEEGERRIRRFAVQDVPALTLEPRMPPLGELLHHVHVSTFPDWKAVGAWYWGLSRDMLDVDEVVRRRTHALVKGLTTDREKVAAIYHYAASETRYVALELGIEGIRPRRAALTLARGWGDCKDKATLIISMLRELGIDASIVLVRTGLRGRFDTSTASLAPFDHAIVYVPSLDLYLDGTAEMTGTEELPVMDRSALALRIDQGQSKLVHLPEPPPARSQERRAVSLTLDKRGGLRVEASLQNQGFAAPAWRDRYQSALSRREEVKSELRGSLGGLELDPGEAGARVHNLDRLEMPVVVEAAGKTTADREGASYAVPMGPSWRLTPQLASLPTREHDLLLGPRRTHTEVWRLTVPAGARVLSKPVDAQVTSPFGSYTVKVTQEGDVVTVTTELVLDRARIAPADYAAWRTFCHQVDAGSAPRVLAAF